MKIALILGVSDYRRATSLPACQLDAEAIDTLLSETRSFEHRLCLAGNLPAQDVKTQVLSFWTGSAVKISARLCSTSLGMASSRMGISFIIIWLLGTS